MRKVQDEEMEDDAELLLERVEEEMAEEYSEEEDGYVNFEEERQKRQRQTQTLTQKNIIHTM